MLIRSQIFTLGLIGFTMYDAIHSSTASAASEMSWQNKTQLRAELLWITSIVFIRASVLSLYIRIFPTPSFRLSCYIVQGSNLAYFVAMVLACCLICRPLTFLWNQSNNGSCGELKSFDLFLGVSNLLLDVTTVALPMPVLWGLQMRTKQKLRIVAMFSIGVA